MKYSIIVPVYNVEQFLETCIESILHQNFIDYEIIAVNDGSTDGSKEILEDYQSFERFTVGKLDQNDTIEKNTTPISNDENSGGIVVNDFSKNSNDNINNVNINERNEKLKTLADNVNVFWLRISS